MRYFVLNCFLKKSLIVAFLFSFLLNPFSVLAREVTDRFGGELWYLDQISAPEAWEMETGSEQTIVAVLDAGFDLTHEDLIDQYWSNADEIDTDGIDNDVNGYEDDVQGWDFVDNDSDPSPVISEDFNDTVVSHGTVVSGIIGATANNGLGIAGINWDISIMPLRVLGEYGAGSTANVRRAIRYAVENGADVINLSFTFSQPDDLLAQTIKWAYEQGVVVVAAVGNGNTNTDIQPVYPACFDQQLGVNAVIGVASTDQNDQKASFSNFGTLCTDLSAPGVDIFAAVYHDNDSISFVTSYASPWEGTSLSAPMVSAAAALLRSAHPTLTPDQIRNALKLSVDPVKESSLDARKQLGAGRLNLSRALEYASVFVKGVLPGSLLSSVIPSHSFVVAQGPGSSSVVRRISGRGDILAEFNAYGEDFHGGIRLAMGDIDGDGEEEIVTGPGPGGGPQVRIFNIDGQLEGQFFAFDEGHRYGIFVASGDVNADGIDEILVTSDKGGSGQVRIFNNRGFLKGAFFPLGRTTEPVRVVLGNVDEDAEEEIISTRGSGGNGFVFINDANGRYIHSFLALGGSVSGFTLASADINHDGRHEIFVSPTSGSIPQIGIYNQKGELQRSFLAFPSDYRGGVEIAVGDIDHNGLVEAYIVPQQAGGPQVRLFNSLGEVIGGFFAFDSANRFGTSIAIE
ncbi:S8 family serine peptidase [Candidatus Uhrbacteria bacterium]|nr:S8 family serine peptidase [Candidatus Uhrbacteria bacterium]